MPKKYKSFEHLFQPDPHYKNKLVGKFINCMMWDGKKTTAQHIFYQALKRLGEKVKDKEPLEVFETAMNNVKPVLEVRSRRIGGATYQVPVQVESKRQTSLAIRWILHAVRKKKGRPAHIKLADELEAAYKGAGEAITARENVHKMAEANKAFAHFAHF